MQKHISVGRYSIGAFVGEEWIYYKRYTDREETCVAREASCVLEMNTEAFESIRETLFDGGMSKDISMFETQLKRSYNIKKARIAQY